MARQALPVTSSLSQIRDSLRNKPDYSLAFTSRVEMLSRKVEDELKAPVEHDRDMNERVCQVISLWLNKQYRPIPPRDDRAKWCLNTEISSKGPYFIFIVLRLTTADAERFGLREGQAYWGPVDDRKVPTAVKSFEERIASVLIKKGFHRLDEHILSQQAEGKNEFEEPATVYDVLFGEIETPDANKDEHP
jgi:hypothetical protein